MEEYIAPRAGLYPKQDSPRRRSFIQFGCVALDRRQSLREPTPNGNMIDRWEMSGTQPFIYAQCWTIDNRLASMVKLWAAPDSVQT